MAKEPNSWASLSGSDKCRACRARGTNREESRSRELYAPASFWALLGNCDRNHREFCGWYREVAGVVVTSNYTQERSVDRRGAQLMRTGIVAGRSGNR